MQDAPRYPIGHIFHSRKAEFAHTQITCIVAPMIENAIRNPRTAKRQASDGKLRQGSRSPGAHVLKYAFRVSKDDRSFAEVLNSVIERYYENDSDFAASAGISPAAVSRYVSGKQVPKPSTLEKMAPAMRMSTSRLASIAYPTMGGTGQHAPPSMHPLALDLNRLLDEGSPMPEVERGTLETLISSVMSPYRRYLRERKSA